MHGHFGHIHVYNVHVRWPQASKKKERKVFYTMPEYEAWKESLGGNTSGWSIKYYKARRGTGGVLYIVRRSPLTS